MGTFPVRAWAVVPGCGARAAPRQRRPRPGSIRRLMSGSRCACAVWSVPGRCRGARRCAWTGYTPTADGPVPGLAPICRRGRRPDGASRAPSRGPVSQPSPPSRPATPSRSRRPAPSPSPRVALGWRRCRHHRPAPAARRGSSTGACPPSMRWSRPSGPWPCGAPPPSASRAPMPWSRDSSRRVTSGAQTPLEELERADGAHRRRPADGGPPRRGHAPRRPAAAAIGPGTRQPSRRPRSRRRRPSSSRTGPRARPSAGTAARSSPARAGS